MMDAFVPRGGDFSRSLSILQTAPSWSIRADAKMPYGDVEYADPGYQSDGKKRYPIDTEEHVHAALSYINQAGNASQYTASQLASIKGRIHAAAKKFGIEVADDNRSAPEGTLTRGFAADLSVEGRTIVGLAAPFNRVATVSDDGRTTYKEAFERGAFAVTIAQRGNRVRAHAQHRTERLPIGKAAHLEETRDGLVSHLRVSDTVDGNDVLALVRDGVMTGLSIGFRGIKHSMRSGVKVRTEVALSEISVVADPAYADAQISAIRQMHDLDLDEYIAERVNEVFASRYDPASLAVVSQGITVPDDPHTVQSVRSIKQQIAHERAAFLLKYRNG